MSGASRRIGEAIREVSWVRDRTNYGGFMKLDRDAHRKMLEDAAACYPHWVQWDLADFPGLDEEDVAGNLLYLEELGLIKSGVTMALSGDFMWGPGKATAAGLDFIQDDGGYSAILGTVTIKLHEDTLKELMAQKVLDSDLPQADKKRWTDGLRALPADAIKHLSLKLIDVGMSHGPDGLHWLGKYLGMS